MRNGFVNIVIAVLVLVVLVGIVGYVLVKKSEVLSPTMVTPTSTSISIASASSTVDVSTWKTYRNEEYGFELKYPVQMQLSVGIHIPPHGTDLILPNDNHIETEVTLKHTKSEGRLSVWIFTKDIADLEKYIEQQFGSEFDIQKKAINDNTAYRVQFQDVARIYFQNSERVFIFQYDDSLKSEAENILSTINFFKPNSSASSGQATTTINLSLLHTSCKSTGTCPSPMQCLSYYGIAGPQIPEFQTCEIPCKTNADCPASLSCSIIADGPGRVCIR